MGNVAKYRVYKAYSCLAYATPMATLFGLNSDVYLKDSTGGTSIGFWGFVILVFVALAFKSKIMEFAKKNTILSISIIVFGVALIMQFIAGQLMLISAVSMGGAVASSVFEPVADYYYSIAYKQINEESRVRLNLAPVTQREAWRQAYGFKVNT
jgi:hypothetical protein